MKKKPHSLRYYPIIFGKVPESESRTQEINRRVTNRVPRLHRSYYNIRRGIIYFLMRAFQGYPGERIEKEKTPPGQRLLSEEKTGLRNIEANGI